MCENNVKVLDNNVKPGKFPRFKPNRKFVVHHQILFAKKGLYSKKEAYRGNYWSWEQTWRIRWK